jgi:hypothetical protein
MTVHSKTAILDSGYTRRFVTNNAPCKITKENKPPLTVHMPNDETNISCNTAKLNLPTLNEQARKAHVFEDLNNNLIYVGQLCSIGYNVNFDKHKATNGTQKYTTKCDHSNGLWRAPLADHTYNFQHGTQSRPQHAPPQHAPYPWRSPTFGTKIQLTPPSDSTPLVNKNK